MSSAKWQPFCPGGDELRQSNLYVSENYIIIVSDNGLLPAWQQTIISNNDGFLLIGHLAQLEDFRLMKLEYIWR